MHRAGVFVGRFQPFHNGHLSATLYALRRVGHLYIVVGSTNVSNSRNPFTFEERREFITSTLDSLKIDRAKYSVVGIPDVHDNDRWIRMVLRKTPGIEVAFSNNRTVVRLFGGKGVKVVSRTLAKNRVSGTAVRRAMRTGGNWRSMVPPAVAERIGRTKRI